MTDQQTYCALLIVMILVLDTKKFPRWEFLCWQSKNESFCPNVISFRYFVVMIYLLCSVKQNLLFRQAASIQNSHGGNSGSSTLSLAGLMDRSGDSFLKASPQSLYIELSIVILDCPMCYLFRWRDASLPSGFPQWEFGVMWLMSLEV